MPRGIAGDGDQYRMSHARGSSVARGLGRAALLMLLFCFAFAASSARVRADEFGAFGPEGARMREQLWILPSGEAGRPMRATVFRPQDDPVNPGKRRPTRDHQSRNRRGDAALGVDACLLLAVAVVRRSRVHRRAAAAPRSRGDGRALVGIDRDAASIPITLHREWSRRTISPPPSTYGRRSRSLRPTASSSSAFRQAAGRRLRSLRVTCRRSKPW